MTHPTDDGTNPHGFHMNFGQPTIEAEDDDSLEQDYEINLFDTPLDFDTQIEVLEKSERIKTDAIAILVASLKFAGAPFSSVLLHEDDVSGPLEGAVLILDNDRIDVPLFLSDAAETLRTGKYDR